MQIYIYNSNSNKEKLSKSKFTTLDFFENPHFVVERTKQKYNHFIRFLIYGSLNLKIKILLRLKIYKIITVIVKESFLNCLKQIFGILPTLDFFNEYVVF